MSDRPGPGKPGFSDLGVRLQVLFRWIPEDSIGVIDVGTDHGLLPLALAKNGFGGNLLASDIHADPLQAARRAAKVAGEAERIRFLLCDGLALCPPEAVDTVVIAGMGGDTICSILDRAEWVMEGNHRLLLQPMTHADVVRYWLIHNAFTIRREAAVRENGRVFQVLEAVYGQGEKHSDAELLIGREQALREGDAFRELAEQERKRLRKRLKGLQAAEAGNDSALSFFQGVCEELEEIYARI